MAVIFEHFNTLESLVDTIEKRPYNSVFTGEKMSQKTERYDDFFGSKNYEVSIELLKGGYHEPLETMKKEVIKINKQNNQLKPRPFQNIVGYVPHVPNAIQGIPTSMIDREKKAEKSKTIHLLYGFSAVGNVSASDLIKGGTMFIGLVNSLEKAGFRVKLDLVRCTTTSSYDAIGYTVNLKQYNQSLNLLKLCYPLVHPSMLRRTSFKWCETLPELKDSRYSGTYGQSLIVRMKYNGEKEKDFLRKHGVIKDKNSYYCNVYEAMKAKNINDLALKMGLTV